MASDQVLIMMFPEALLARLGSLVLFQCKTCPSLGARRLTRLQPS